MFGNRHDEEPERPRGKRHQPRDMATDRDAAPATNGTPATTANNDRYAQQRQQIQGGQSFLDQMYKSERPGRSGDAAFGGGGKRRVSGQPNQLNVFDWNNGDAAGQRQPTSTAAATRQAPGAQVSSGVPVTSAGQRRRNEEAAKFESHTDGGFLRFSEDAKSQPRQGKVSQPAPKPVAPYGSPEHGMMDGLMRGEPTASKSGAHERSSKRHVAQPQISDGPEFAGFPGMGARSQEKAFAHIRRKEVESNVFLPESVPGLSGAAQASSAEAMRRQPAPPSAPREEEEDVDLDAMMAALDPSQLTDEELQEYVEYLRLRQGGQGESEPSGQAHGRPVWIDSDEDGANGRQYGGYVQDQRDSAMNGHDVSQAQRIMLYQQRQRGL